jgi:metal-responsive CopG/Arc/MetJ family transcriptional regulator
MKTAVSIPDDIFAGAERLARRFKKSRSQLYSEAVRDYVARHATDEVTEAMDRVFIALEQSEAVEASKSADSDAFVAAAAARALKRSEW